jgi:hypothetical protein
MTSTNSQVVMCFFKLQIYVEILFFLFLLHKNESKSIFKTVNLTSNLSCQVVLDS